MFELLINTSTYCFCQGILALASLTSDGKIKSEDGKFFDSAEAWMKEKRNMNFSKQFAWRMVSPCYFCRILASQSIVIHFSTYFLISLTTEDGKLFDSAEAWMKEKRNMNFSKQFAWRMVSSC